MEIVFKVHDRMVDVFYEHAWSALVTMIVHLMLVVYVARALITGAVIVPSVVAVVFITVAILVTLFILDAQTEARNERVCNGW